MPSQVGSAAWHMAQRPCTMMAARLKSGLASSAAVRAVRGGSCAARASPTDRSGAVDSQAMTMRMMAEAAHVQVGLPARACRVLNQ